jgi:hypothetical protein
MMQLCPNCGGYYQLVSDIPHTCNRPAFATNTGSLIDYKRFIVMADLKELLNELEQEAMNSSRDFGRGAKYVINSIRTEMGL